MLNRKRVHKFQSKSASPMVVVDFGVLDVQGMDFLLIFKRR